METLTISIWKFIPMLNNITFESWSSFQKLNACQISIQSNDYWDWNFVSFGINFMLNKLQMIKSISVKLKMIISSLINYKLNLATRNLINLISKLLSQHFINLTQSSHDSALKIFIVWMTLESGFQIQARL